MSKFASLLGDFYLSIQSSVIINNDSDYLKKALGLKLFETRESNGLLFVTPTINFVESLKKMAHSAGLKIMPEDIGTLLKVYSKGSACPDVDEVLTFRLLRERGLLSNLEEREKGLHILTGKARASCRFLELTAKGYLRGEDEVK